jgi:hypothetical protein
MLEAEDQADTAVEKYNLQTKEGVTASTEQLNKALENLEGARTGFAAARDAFPAADMSPFLEYIAAKKALLEKSKKIDETWLADDLEDANELVEEYNDQDKKVAEFGEELPESETVPIAEAYEDLTEDALERYMEARARAAEADTLLRQLLGDEPDGSDVTTGTIEATGTAGDEASASPDATSTQDD